MVWKKIADSSELIVLENESGSSKLKIEARRIDNGWEVFKTKIEGSKSDLISEHLLESKLDAMQLIEKLKEEKAEKTLVQKTEVSLKRVYKEEFVEKWFFSVNNENMRNFIVIKFDTYLKADIVMHESYALREKEILSQIEEKLGLPEFGDALLHEIYYFKRYNKVTQKGSHSDMNGAMDIEFDFSDEEYY